MTDDPRCCHVEPPHAPSCPRRAQDIERHKADPFAYPMRFDEGDDVPPLNLGLGVRVFDGSEAYFRVTRR